MHKTRILVAGCGDVGTALGVMLAQRGAHVLGLRRTINQLPAAIQPIRGDLSLPHGLPPLPACDYLVYTAAAGRRDPAHYHAIYVEGLRRVLRALPKPPRRLFFASSSSLYGQQQHEWVDEFSPTQPTSDTGRILLQAEAVALNARCPATLVRFSGIYGPGREHLLSLVRSGIQAPPNPVHYSNRIHRDDCAGVLAHLLRLDQENHSLAPVYLASDDAPTPISEVMAWLGQQIGVEASSQRTVQRGGSKRLSNRRLKGTGYSFRYPDYRAGFSALVSP